jgi:ADP-ribose pyrophosphatase YjhB (NUDIX family)
MMLHSQGGTKCTAHRRPGLYTLRGDMSAPRREPRFVHEVPEGDNRPRRVCSECGFVDYVNPKVVVGSVATWEGRVLLCRRAIEPRCGFWTLPAGYLEEKESTEDGAVREAREEANARIEIVGLLGVYNIPRISQVQLIYEARLLSPEVSAGEETLDVGLFGLDAVPWMDLAFSTVRWALEHHAQVAGLDRFPAFGNPPGESSTLPPGL